MHGLYAIVDLGALEERALDPLAFAEAALEGGARVVQLRAKAAPDTAVVDCLRALAPACAAAGAPLVVNDRPDLALLAGCTFLHVGQSDASPAEVRRASPGLALGISTHDVGQLERALAERPAYVAFGPVYATASKPAPDPVVGLAGLRVASARARGRAPLCAIGGITPERAAEVARLADLVAVIGGLLPAPGTTGAAARAAVRAQAEVYVRAIHGASRAGDAFAQEEAR